MTNRATDLADLETTLPLDTVVHWLTTLWDNGWHPMDIARTIGTDTANKVPLAAVVDAIAVGAVLVCTIVVGDVVIGDVII